MILEYPPPASFLNLTRAKSGNTGCVKIHHKSDCARWRNHCCLRITEAVSLTQLKLGPNLHAPPSRDTLDSARYRYPLGLCSVPHSLHWAHRRLRDGGFESRAACPAHCLHNRNGPSVRPIRHWSHSCPGHDGCDCARNRRTPPSRMECPNHQNRPKVGIAKTQRSIFPTEFGNLGAGELSHGSEISKINVHRRHA